jgi:hypothetical protein
MPAWICRTCGVQQSDTDQPPADCPICNDERQYVGRGADQQRPLADGRRRVGADPGDAGALVLDLAAVSGGAQPGQGSPLLGPTPRPLSTPLSSAQQDG